MKHSLNLFEVNMVNTSFFITLFVCEIPTGAFADIFGRKASFVLACALISVSMFVYGSSSTLCGFVLAEVICAIGFTFRSGAFQAWLVDSLKHCGYDGDLTRIFARENLICQIGGGCGAIAGSYIYAYDPAWPWFSGGAGLLIVAVIAQTIMKEKYFVRQAVSWSSGFIRMKGIALTSIRYGMKDKAVRFLLLVTFAQVFAVQALNMYWQPFFKGHHIRESNLGYVFAGIMVSVAIGSLIIARMKCAGKEKAMILWVQIITGALVIVSAVIAGLPMIMTFFLLHEAMRGMDAPLKNGYLQKRIPSAERATISSFCAISPHIGGVFGLLLSGLIAQSFGINVAWIVSGSVLIVVPLLLMSNGSHASD